MTPSPVADTVNVYEPGTMAEVVVMVSVEEHVMVQEEGEKDALAPLGSAETAKETEVGFPDVWVTVTPVLTDLPGMTEPVLGVRETSNLTGIVVTVRA